MNCSWKKDGVSDIEPEEVFIELKSSGTDALPHPIGVVIYGADSGLKAKVFELFRRKLNKPFAFNRKPIGGRDIGNVKSFLYKGKPILICVHGEDAIRHNLRHRTVKQLRELGAKSIVGVYVKVTEKDKLNFEALAKEPSFSYQLYQKQVEKLSLDPPTPDGLDYYLVISSE